MKKEYLFLVIPTWVVLGYLLIGFESSKNFYRYNITMSLPEVQDSFSEDALKSYLKSSNVKFPEVAFAQAKLETGDFSSDIFKENNNLFGMKMAYQRPKTSIGINRGHATYSDWKMSVLDYAIYQSKYLSKAKSQEEYLKLLSNSYAEDPRYIKKLRKILDSLEF
jgi:flagellum-specific peptidoglycan hydrolase FlgJ